MLRENRLFIVLAFLIFLSGRVCAITENMMQISGTINNFTYDYIEIATGRSMIKVPIRFFEKSYRPKWNTPVVVEVPMRYRDYLEFKVIAK